MIDLSCELLTYRVHRKKRFFLWPAKITVLEKLPLQWAQVFRLWAVIALGIGALWTTAQLVEWFHRH